VAKNKRDVKPKLEKGDLEKLKALLESEEEKRLIPFGINGA
jgi:hypothetical protein